VPASQAWDPKSKSQYHKKKQNKTLQYLFI
jgi:hypothetical protein